MEREPATAVTGLIDVHVHIRSVDGIATLATAGIIAARDAGLRENAASGREWPRLLRKQPAVMSARWALYKKGGYGARFGVAVETREEIKTEILNLKNAGADIIKIMASGIVSLKEPGNVTAGGFTTQEIQLIVDEARKLGLNVMAHANGEAAIISCAKAGVRSIEHGFFMTNRALEALAQQEIFWTPTVGALVRAAGSGPGGASNHVRDFIDGLIRVHLTMIGRAAALGVPLAVGTDCVLPATDYGRVYGEELGYFERAGIAHAGVVAIATSGGARLLGLK
ncbi:MAG TPA: amidohydrolase family protein [Nitrospirota bacterium]|nr:amidohydrolase family protein [Nitrospirota bacterium]